VKASNVNDAVHHFTFAFYQSYALSGTTLNAYIQLIDGATNQCCIVFRSDGAILLTSGGPTGTVLDTYLGAITLTSQWFAFDIEVVINNTTGSWAVRRNGNTSNDHAQGSLNTRGGTTNNYANKIAIGQQAYTASGQRFDDFLWRSDASSVAWVGDIRTYVRMPASDVSVQFTRIASAIQTPFSPNTTGSVTNTTARFTPFTAAYDGTIGAATVTMTTGYTGNLKCSLFASSGGQPGAVLGSATTISNPATGSNAITFGTPVPVVQGTQYFLGFISDTSSGTYSFGPNSLGFQQTGTTYAAFPVASPTVTTSNPVIATLTITPSTNKCLVNEAQQDGATTYVYDSNVGDADFYGIAPIAVTPASVVAVTTRGFVQKSDAGSRSGGVQLRSGSSVVTTPTTWNPSDKSASITLSNANLTAAQNTTNGGVRSVQSVTGGKYYWEVTMTTWSQSQTMVGVASPTCVLSSVASSALQCAMVQQGGSMFVNGSPQGPTLPGCTTGAVICIAVDVSAALTWFRVGAAGQWNASGTANPATGVGGFSISSITSAGIFALWAAATYGPDAGTANFGGSAFVGTPPSGFTAGLSTTTTGTTVQATGVLSTTWAWNWRTDTTDPATGAAWTPVGVSNVTIGPICSG